MYISIIKNITNNEIIITSRIYERVGGRRGKYKYSLNQAYIKKHVELNKFINKQIKYFIDGFIDDVETKPTIDFIDDVKIEPLDDVKVEFMDDVKVEFIDDDITKIPSDDDDSYFTLNSPLDAEYWD